MKRRTLRQLHPKRQPADHHHSSVVLLNGAVDKILHEHVVDDSQKA